MTSERGVSLLELVVAMALTLAIAASVFAMMRAGWSGAAAEPETADMQQRLRVAAGTITREMLVAGAGSSLGGQAAALVSAFPPVLPFRKGAVGADPAGTFRSDTVTLISVPATIAQTTLRADAAPGAQMLLVAPQPNCPAGLNVCGFAAGMTLLVYDETGNYDIVTVASVADGSGEIGITPRPADSFTTTYKAGSRIVEAQLRTYYMKTDAVTQIAQLMQYDGSANPGIPVVDHVAGLRFEYFGEPRPPMLTAAGATYGPAPPPAGVSTSRYPPGENCLFAADGAGVRSARLPPLGADDSLSALTALQLTDGPWCPDDVAPNRWDADLLRIRTVVVTVRVESALAALRGPAGPLFVHAGTSRGGATRAPDSEIRFQVTPRNLRVSR